MNYYEILEVSPNASQAVLKAAYKSLMQRYHPDRNPGGAEAAEHSLLVVQAYEVLSDSSKRAAYDIELKRQMANLDDIRNRSRVAPSPAVMSDAEKEPKWFLWLLLAPILLVVWFVWSPSEKMQFSGSGLKEVGSVLGGYRSALLPNQENESTTDATVRTIPIYIEELNVKLETSAESTGAPLADSPHLLSIPTLGIVVGAFDAEEFISFMEDNKEYIRRKLSEKLVSADYEMLMKHNGDQYLKRFILVSIGEITEIDRLKEYPAPGTESPTHYGAVDILLPDSFTVE